MNKTLDRVLDTIDVGLQRAGPAHALHTLCKPRCWRCLHRYPRDEGNPESLCEACFDYCTGESDLDPTRIRVT